jgi:hypothetical protein
MDTPKVNSTLRFTKYQIFPIVIAGAGQATSLQNATTDRNYQKVKGIGITCSDQFAETNAIFTKFEVNRREIYPNGWEIKMNTTGQDVGVNDRYDERVDEDAANSVVDVTVQDKSAAGTVYPYTVNVYLLLETPLS